MFIIQSLENQQELPREALQVFMGGKKKDDLRRDRTCNLLIRSQAPMGTMLEADLLEDVNVCAVPCHWASRPV